MSSASESDASNYSPAHGPVPTPGGGLDKSRSNSPEYPPADGGHHSDRSRSASRTSQKSGSAASRSRSNSAESNKSDREQRTASRASSRRSRSRSVASNRSSGSNKSGSERSKSPKENRSRSRSGESNRSGSAGSKSGGSRSRSRSSGSNRSRSNSAASSKSGSSGSRKRSRSRSRSLESNKSGSPSPSKADASDNQVVTDEKGNETVKSSFQTKNKLIDTDSEPEPEPEREPEQEIPEASAAALFGDADDISSEDDDEQRQDEQERDERRESVDEDQRGRQSGDENQQPVIEDDEEKEVEPIPETRIDVEIPKISCDLGKDIHFVKLPNFLSVDTRPFDQETYEDEIDEEETLDEEGRARLKLKVENTIRWREVPSDDGSIAKESNARLVRWSDGSLSLHLGSEIFDVYKQPLQGDHNHLFIRQGTGLQGQAVFRTKLSFRPHSTESFTHRKMTLSLADRSQKTSGIKILSQVGVDPDQDRKTLLKKEEEKLRQTVRAKPKKRGEGTSRPHHVGGNAYREEEGSDEEGAISLNAIKNKYKSGHVPNKGGAIYSSDEDGSDFEAQRGRKQDKPKVLKVSESSEESE